MNTTVKIGLIGMLLASAMTLSANEWGAEKTASVDTVHDLPPDTVILEDVKTGERRRVRIVIPDSDDQIIRIEKTDREYVLSEADRVVETVKKRTSSRPIYGITFSRVDLGLVKLVDNGSLNLSQPNEDLAYRPGKTVNFGFDVLQAGYRFNDNFRVFLSGGFDWTYVRLREDIVLRENTTPLGWDRPGTDYDKNRLTSTYLRLPLTIEFRSNYHPGIGRVRFAFGPEAGVLLKGTQRLKSEEFGKQKFKDDYNLSSFRYGAFARVGAGSFGVYAKYYFNDFFENSPNQAGMQSFAFGLMLGF